MKQFVLVSVKPTVTIIVSNSGTTSTDSAQPAICAATHSSRKTARRRTKNSTITHGHDNDHDEQDEEDDDQLGG